MNRLVPSFLLLLAGVVAAQAPERRAFDRAAPREDAIASLHEVFPDLAARLAVRDRGASPALESRLEAIDRELKLWETVRRYAAEGRIVELDDLAPTKLANGSIADLPAERAATEAARRKLSERLAHVETARKAAPSADAPAKAPVGHGRSLLELVVDAPPVAAKAAPQPVVRATADPAGLSKALFEAGDFQGALDALAQLPETSRTPELRYRKARALEQLRRYDEAKTAYAETVQADPEGFYGRQAKWMLDLNAKFSTARGAGAPAPAKKER
jgi:tetratricopeptide (TPR) repeat protein